jgi:hypothetical protein
MDREKVELALEYNNLEVGMESGILTAQELIRFRQVFKDLDKIWALKEIKARRCSRDRDILGG